MIDAGKGIDWFKPFSLAFRIDGKRAIWNMRHQRGEHDLFFNGKTVNQEAVTAMKEGSLFAMTIPWPDQGSVEFRWSLEGSSKSIQKSCESTINEIDRKGRITMCRFAFMVCMLTALGCSNNTITVTED